MSAIPIHLLSDAPTTQPNQLEAALAWLPMAGMPSVERIYIQAWRWLKPQKFIQQRYRYDTFETYQRAHEIMMDCFPQHVSQSAQLITSGAEQSVLENFYVQIFEEYCQDSWMWGCEVEQWVVGIPFDVMGYYPDEEDAYDPIYREFHVQIFPMEPEAYRKLISSLEKTLHPVLTQICTFVRWVAWDTGNILADENPESLANNGYESIPWSPENMQFMSDLHTEADAITDTVCLARDALKSSPLLKRILEKNIERANNNETITWDRYLALNRHQNVRARNLPTNKTIRRLVSPISNRPGRIRQRRRCKTNHLIGANPRRYPQHHTTRQRKHRHQLSRPFNGRAMARRIR